MESAIETQLRRDAEECRRQNRIRPDQPPKKSYIETALEGQEGPFIAASDYVKALGEQLTPWIPGDYHVLGTDGMGRSETRESLRRHFEVDKEFITLTALSALKDQGKIEASVVAQAVKDLGIDGDKPNPVMM